MSWNRFLEGSPTEAYRGALLAVVVCPVVVAGAGCQALPLPLSSPCGVPGEPVEKVPLVK